MYEDEKEKEEEDRHIILLSSADGPVGRDPFRDGFCDH
jgi:hypothetical protein